MKGTRFYKLIIIALVLLNIGTLVYFEVTKPRHPPRPGQSELVTDLELKGDAKSKVNALEKEHHKEKKKLIYRDHELQRKLFNKIGSGESVVDLQMQIDKNKAKIGEMTFIFFDNVAHYCDAKQKKKLIKIVQKRLNQIRPGPPPPPRR